MRVRPPPGRRRLRACADCGPRLSQLPPPIMGIFDKPSFNSGKKRDFPEGLWQKCPSCGEMIHNLELVQNLRVCPKCDHHFTVGARDRIEQLIDDGTFTEQDAGMKSVDILKFTG